MRILPGFFTRGGKEEGSKDMNKFYRCCRHLIKQEVFNYGTNSDSIGGV